MYVQVGNCQKGSGKFFYLFNNEVTRLHSDITHGAHQLVQVCLPNVRATLADSAQGPSAETKVERLNIIARPKFRRNSE